MNQQTTDNRIVDGTHVRVYDGNKYVSSMDLPRVDPRRVLSGLFDIRDAQNTFESGEGLPAEIPFGYSLHDAPSMITHCIESLMKTDRGHSDDLITDSLTFRELMGALVAAYEYMKMRDETISRMVNEANGA